MKRELRPRQAEALDPLRPRWVHADPPGTGKTPMGLTWAVECGAERALIIAPAKVVSHWIDMVPLWSPLRPVLGMGTPVKRAEARDDVRANGGALVMSYETMRQDTAALIDHPVWDAAIFDEAHRLKGRKNIVHKQAVKLTRRIPLLDLATGSPILNDAEEAWSLLHLVDPKKWSSFWRWAHEYFEVSTTDFHGSVQHPIAMVGNAKPGALEAIAAEVGELLVMRDEDYLLPDLAKMVEYDYEVDMLPEEARAYESMLKHKWIRTDDGRNIVASNTVAMMTRLRQLASDWGELLDTDTPGSKVETAVEVVKQIDAPTLVLVSFKHTAYRLHDELVRAGIGPVEIYTGDQKDKELARAKKAFIDGKAPVLIGTFGVIREGVDGLQHASNNVVLVDHEWTPELNRQAIARLRRYGQDAKQVFVHHIVLNNSMDATVAHANARKQNVIDAIVGKSTDDVLHGRI